MGAKKLNYNPKTLATMYSGFGGTEQGFVWAGYTPVFAIDNNPDAVEAYTNNFGNHCLDKNVCDFDYSAIKANHLHASPSCKKFSSTNHRGGEDELDVWCAKATVRAIAKIKPDTFSLENVKQYLGSRSFRLIRDSLLELGYASNVEIVNAKDFGVAQSRERLILRAWHPSREHPKPLSLWKMNCIYGWYEAIADLIPNLKPLPLTKWQLASLAEQGISTDGLTALVSKDGSRKQEGFTGTFARVIPPDKPCPTLKALGGSQHCQQYSIVVDGVSYRISTETIARLMGFPDSYKFLGVSYKDCMGLGNAIPPVLAKAIAESFSH